MKDSRDPRAIGEEILRSVKGGVGVLVAAERACPSLSEPSQEADSAAVLGHRVRWLPLPISDAERPAGERS